MLKIIPLDQLHAQRRRPWDRAFSMSALRSYQQPVNNRLAQLCEQLDAHQGEPIDLHTWLGYLVYDVMTDLAYGGRLITSLPVCFFNLIAA